jgi:hypothetical protein
MEKEEMTLSERVASDLTIHPASHHKWAYHYKELPGMWVLINGEDGSPKVLEYKNFRVRHDGEDWVATYEEAGSYPSVVKETPWPIFAKTLPEVYVKLLSYYKENEPIQTKRDYEDWQYLRDRAKKGRQERDEDMRNNPEGLPWNVRIIKGKKLGD